MSAPDQKVTLARLRTIAAHFDGTIEEQRANGEYCIEALTPPGIVWASNDLHIIVEVTADDLTEWRNAARADLLDQVKLGTRPCEASDCDTCQGDDK